MSSRVNRALRLLEKYATPRKPAPGSEKPCNATGREGPTCYGVPERVICMAPRVKERLGWPPGSAAA
jgi:hypothetical protein